MSENKVGHKPGDYLNTFLSLNGAGAVFNANVNGGVTPQEFDGRVPQGNCWRVHRLIWFVEDNANLSAEKYGALSQLTNGVDLHVIDHSTDNVLQDLTPLPIKSNGQWAAYCYDLNIVNVGSGNSFACARWSIDRGGGALGVEG